MNGFARLLPFWSRSVKKQLSFRGAILSREEPAACPANSSFLTGLSPGSE
jgi:hypothetical protein